MVLVVFAAAGAVAGLVWEWVWTPPDGVAVQGRWSLDGVGLAEDFSGTGLFVLVGTGTGLVTGALTAWWASVDELGVIAVTVVGAVLATAAMWGVGTSVDPPDPTVVASTTEDGRRVPGDLHVAGASPFLAPTAGALLGAAVVLLRGRARRPT